MTLATIPEGDFVLLIDASSYFHRNFHTATKTVRRADGQETGAIIAFCWSLMKLIRLNKTMIGRRPSHAAVIMDSRGKNFRHDLYPRYKAQRSEYEPGLESQLPFIPDVADAFNLPCMKPDGFEADDVIATYADMAEREGLNVVIASSDKDFHQLVSGRVFIYDAMKDKDPERFDVSRAIVDINGVFEKWGVWPWEFADLQALMGDKVDNVPGVPGIGPKKGAALLKKFASLEEMISEADFGEVERFASEKEMRAIAEHADDIRISRQLVELARNVPVPLDVDDLRLKQADIWKLKDFFMSLESPQLARKVDF